MAASSSIASPPPPFAFVGGLNLNPVVVDAEDLLLFCPVDGVGAGKDDALLDLILPVDLRPGVRCPAFLGHRPRWRE